MAVYPVEKRERFVLDSPASLRISIAVNAAVANLATLLLRRLVACTWLATLECAFALECPHHSAR